LIPILFLIVFLPLFCSRVFFFSFPFAFPSAFVFCYLTTIDWLILHICFTMPVQIIKWIQIHLIIRQENLKCNDGRRGFWREAFWKEQGE
jgi:hypothetical protein